MVTIFSLNLNDYFNNDLQKKCVDSWNNYKNKNKNIKAIVIYNELSPDYIEFWRLFKPVWELYTNKRIEFIADAFRIYILAKYDHYLWLDGDVLISEDDLDEIFLNEVYLDDCWDKIYNADDTQLFREIWKKFLSKSFVNMKDKEIFNYLKLARPSDLKLFNWNKTFIHLSILKKQCGTYVVVDNNDFNYFERFNKLWASAQHTLISKNKDRIIFCTKEPMFFKKRYRSACYFSNQLKAFVKFTDKKNLPKLIEQLETKYCEK